MERIQGLRIPRVPEQVRSRVRIQNLLSLTPKPPFCLPGQLIQENKSSGRVGKFAALQEVEGGEGIWVCLSPSPLSTVTGDWD